MGFAVGAPLTNLFYDLSGTYQPMLYGSAAIMVVVAIAFQRISTVVQQEQKSEEM